MEGVAGGVTRAGDRSQTRRRRRRSVGEGRRRPAFGGVGAAGLVEGEQEGCGRRGAG